MPPTVIRRFANDPANEALDVEFVSGRRCRYRPVPEDVAGRFRGAFSKGRFFNAHIRHYPCAPLADDEPSALTEEPART